MAGGKSSRMGVDKSFIPFIGKPMIERVIERVDGLGSELIIITNNPASYSPIGLPTYGDIYKESGPLGGLHSALYHATNAHVLVVACDMPWLNRALLEFMISLMDTADIVVPRWDKYPEPLHAVYSRECLKPVEDCLEAGILNVVGFYGRVKVRFLDKEHIAPFDPGGRSFANVNTPQDLAAAANPPGSEDQQT